MKCATAVLLLVVVWSTPLGAVELLWNVSSGYDNATGLVIGDGLPDPDYTITPGPLTAVVPPAIPSPPWVANTATSKWIGFNNAGSNAPEGTYDYTTTVSLPAIDASKVALAGAWSTDNDAPDILVNGISTGATHDGNFGVLRSFGPLGAGLFQPGANTVTFRVHNAAPSDNPTGLRVDGGVYSYGLPASFDLPIYNTGVDGNAMPLSDNSVDPHWTLSGTGAAQGQGPAAIVARESGGFPIGPWLADNVDLDSAWITPSESTSGPGATDGTAIYTFWTLFDTPMAGTVTIAGLQSADNSVVGVELDGVAGTFTPVGFNTWGDFSVSADVTGTQHTLSFLVQNGAGEASPDGPIGLRVHVTSAEFVPIPEPSTFVLTAMGLVLLAGYGWRRRGR